MTGNEALEILTEYQEIEQELGVNLIILLKAFKQKIVYYKEYNEIYEMKIYDVRDILSNHLYVWNIMLVSLGVWKSYKAVKISDYGKTWALTKEELE